MEDIQKSKEIDIIGLIQAVLKERRLLAKFIGAAAIIGVIVALSTPKTYKSEVMLAPELSSGGLGLADNLADMAANFGIDMGSKSSMDAIYPELYPDIFGSTDFIMGLLDTPVRLKDDNQTRTYQIHVTRELKFPFWQYPKLLLMEMIKRWKNKQGSGKGIEDPYRISKDENDICNGIRGNILCSIDKKTSVITISVTDQDPLVAAIIADTLQSRLQTYITNYRTNKARTDYDYYYALTDKAKQNYEDAMRQYAHMSDANTHISLKSMALKLEDLENDMQLKYNTYTTLNTQLQSAQAKVQERTPAFTIIQRPIMPYKPSSTPRAFIVFAFVILGVLLDAVWVLYGKNIMALLRKQK